MMTLGELIDALPHDSEKDVVFDFCGAFPLLVLGSSRCYYERAALDWTVIRRHSERGGSAPTSAALRDFLTKQLGTTMHGYKGGEYTIDRDTLVHIDGYGECTSTEVASVEVGWRVMIHTEGSL